MFDWIRNASVSVKVAVAPTFAIVCLAVLGALSWVANDRLSSSLIALGEERVPRIVEAADLSEQLVSIHALVNQSLAWEGAGFKSDKIAALDTKIDALLKSYAVTLNRAAGSPRASEAQKRRLSSVLDNYSKYEKAARDALDLKSGMLGNAAVFMTTMDAVFGRIRSELTAIVKEEAGISGLAVTDARDLSASNQIAISSGIVMAMIAALAISTLMSRVIVRPLTDASRVAHAVAHGDLSVRPKVRASQDATGQVLVALGDVSQSLSTIVRDIRETADHVNLASSEIATGNADLSVRTEITASALQQTASSIHELSATICNSADSARKADSMARDASTVAREGGAVVEEVIVMMDRINSQAKKVGEIISVIDGIAFQTNILALNAAVEAARAGAQGRGFSVVAGEVRTLAQRSSAAANEIRTLISLSVEQIDLGVVKVQTAGQTMGRVVAAIEQVSNTVEGISQAAAEQAGAISQVSHAVSEMDHSTQQNAALVEQASAATESLKGEAQRLAQMLHHFRT